MARVGRNRPGRPGPDEEANLELVGLNVGILAGYGLIGLGLTILLVGLLWSATRRLRNLPDDPRIVRILIVLGLVLTALGVVVGAVSVHTP
jgi:heme A synthase